jgi:hypothetical protein
MNRGQMSEKRDHVTVPVFIFDGHGTSHGAFNACTVNLTLRASYWPQDTRRWHVRCFSLEAQE